MKETIKKFVIFVLSFEAKVLLSRTRPKIIAITGSVGKTSTKDAVYTALKSHFHTRKSQKSYNSDIGVALTVLGLSNGGNNPLVWAKNIIDGALHSIFVKDYPHILILEMGVDRKGDMQRLCSWIKPDIVILTRLPDVPAHVEYFSSPDEVIKEKMTLVHALKKEGVLVFNNDDEKIRSNLEQIRQKALGFSRYSPSEFRITEDKILYDGASPLGMEFTLTHAKKAVKMHVVGSLGIQHAYTFAAAAAVATLFDIPLEETSEALKSHLPPQGRMRVIEGIRGSHILDDTYNSSPVACEHALATLGELKTKGRKIAILGDMLELGRYSVREHERIGEFLNKKADLLITLGVRARMIAQGALQSGLSEECILQYDDINELILEVQPLIKKGDVILVKASQGMRSEKIVEALMAQPHKANDLLVRQDSLWLKKEVF